MADRGGGCQVNRFKIFDQSDTKMNGEGVVFSDGTTVVKVNGVTMSYSSTIQAQVIPMLEAQGMRFEWMDV